MSNKKRCCISFLFVLFIFGVSIPLFMSNPKKVKADTITNLTNTTWTINNSVPYSSYSQLNMGTDNILNLNISFTSNNSQYSVLSFYTGLDFDDHEYKYLGFAYTNNNQNPYTQVYSIFVNYSNTSTVLSSSWLNDNYKTIEITGGTDVTNTYLISWLQNNATQQNVTPVGTEITHRYWASYIDMVMTDNEIVGDNNISYKVLLNTYTNNYNEQTLTGLAFTGKLTQINDNYSYIYSTGNNDILYRGTTNTIDNPMLLEFTLGDYMDDDLYDLMDDRGVWFDDARAYMAGTSFGSIYGFNSGVAYGEANATQYTSLVTNILNGLGNILNIQVFPNITIGLLIGLPLLLGVLAVVLKILRG